MTRCAFMQAFRYFFALLLISASALIPGEATAVCTSSATLQIGNSYYVQSEPIDLHLTISNNSSAPVRFGANYPSFRAFNDYGIRIRRSQATEQATDIHEEPASVPIITIKPFETWSVTVYLQDYFNKLTSADYDFNYSIAIPCLDKNFRPIDIIRGQGTFHIMIGATNDTHLSNALSGYYTALESTEYWTQRSAVEALSVTTSPLALPYFQAVIDMGFIDVLEPALRRFKGNPEAENLMLKTVQTAGPSAVDGALKTLANWNYSLPNSDLKSALSRDGTAMKLAALRYAAIVLNPTYKSVIEFYVTDPDQQVAAEAKRVEKSLTKNLQ